MSAQLITKSEEQLNLQEYAAEWKMSNLTILGSKCLRTPVFFPLPNVEVGFCVEIWYQEHDKGFFSYKSCFNLSLKKVFCGDFPKELKTVIKAEVLYHDRTVFKDYAPSAPVSVNEMVSYNFKNVTSEFYKNQCQTDHYRLMSVENGILILRCTLKYFGHLNSLPVNHLKSRSPSSLELFAKDFRSIYSPSILGDVKFIVENKSLFAHKSVLAAHSPVFLKMFTQDFLESKTDSVTIVDTTHDNFENFLKYLYSAEIEDKSLPNLQVLFSLADKYDVRSLKRECVEIAATIISIENIVDILNLVYESGNLEIFTTVKKFAAVHIKDLLPTEKWNDFVLSHPIIAYKVMAEVHRISECSIEAVKIHSLLQV